LVPLLLPSVIDLLGRFPFLRALLPDETLLEKPLALRRNILLVTGRLLTMLIRPTVICPPDSETPFVKTLTPVPSPCVI